MLPKNEHPTFKYELPLSKEVISFRPMTVKDEKILLLTDSSSSSRRTSITRVLENCVTSNIKLDSLSHVDFQALFLTIRAQSIDNIVPLKVTIDGVEHSTKVNINDYKIKHLDKFEKNKKMSFGVNKLIVFRNPNMADYEAYTTKENPDVIDDMIIKCIDEIYVDNQVFTAADFTLSELTEYFNSLPARVLTDFADLFENAPYLYYIVEVEVNGELRSVEVRDFQDFF